jgi:hypothetical protein
LAERNAIAVLIKLLGGEAMTEELKKLGETGEKAMETIQGAAEKVQFGGLGNDLSILIGDIGTFATRSIIALGALKVAADGLGAALFFLAKSGAEAAVQANNAAQAAGLSAKSYQEWAFAADSVGVSQAQVSTALNTFNKQILRTSEETTKAGKAGAQMGRDIQQGVGFSTETFKDLNVEVTRFGENTKGAGDKAKAGAAKTKTGFDELGISVKNASGALKTNDELLAEVANAFQKMPDGARKSAIAIKLFGLEGAKLIPLLDKGAAGIEEFKARAAALGIVFTDDQIKAALAFDDSLNELKKSISGLLRQIGLIFVPSFTAGFNAFRDLILRNKQAVLDFANNALAKAKVLVADFFAALSGRDADVSNKWIIEWRDAIVGFGQDAFHVVNGVVLPAFKLLREGAGLVTEAFNKIFGTSITSGELLILGSITQILGGFQVLRTAIFTAINALSLFSRALLSNPWLAVLTVVAGGIALWVTRTDQATAALRVHEDLIGKVGSAYDQAGRKVAEMSQQVKDAALIQARLSQDAANKGLSSAIDDAINAIQQFDGLLPHAADKLFDVFKQFQGTKDVEAFRAEVSKIGAENPELGKLAQQFLDITNNAHKLAQDGQESANFIGLLTGKLTDSEFAAKQAALGIAGFSADAKAATTDVNNLGTAVDTAKTKVESLGQTITVFRGGGPGGSLTKEVFDVVDGVAHRADQSKAALDGVAESAKAAGENIKNVSSEITNSISDAVKPDAATAGVDAIVTDVNRIAPAAQQAADETNSALSSIDAGSAAQAADAVVAPFEGLPGKISSILSGIQSLVQNGFAALSATVNSLAGQIDAAISRILSALQAAAEAARQLRAQASGSAADSGGSHGGFADGGHLATGPGTATSDSIPIWASLGEFITRAKAVAYYGPGVFHALNNMTLPRDFFKAIRGFNIGGVVDGFSRSLTVPRMASGGMVPALVAAGASAEAGGTMRVKLDFGLGIDQVFDLVTDTFTATRLQQFAIRQQQTSAGRRPGK